ncbi:hypothetical protein FACS1894109_13170 [Spirochaetia bacterium]|nr:hypothetical protein FACS1894109_13170 [Spirochaetia bacterium]
MSKQFSLASFAGSLNPALCNITRFKMPETSSMRAARLAAELSPVRFANAALAASPFRNIRALATALNPTAGIYTALRAMQPFQGLDLRTPGERVVSHILEERAAWGRALSALEKRGKGNANKEQSPEVSGNESNQVHEGAENE